MLGRVINSYIVFIEVPNPRGGFVEAIAIEKAHGCMCCQRRRLSEVIKAQVCFLNQIPLDRIHDMDLCHSKIIIDPVIGIGSIGKFCSKH